MFKRFRGDTWNFIYEFADTSGNPMNLTGASARLQIRNDRDEIVLQGATNTGEITVDTEKGVIRVTFPASATRTVSPGSYRFDLEVIFPSGDVRTYTTQGDAPDTLIVIGDVTHD